MRWAPWGGAGGRAHLDIRRVCPQTCLRLHKKGYIVPKLEHWGPRVEGPIHLLPLPGATFEFFHDELQEFSCCSSGALCRPALLGAPDGGRPNRQEHFPHRLLATLCHQVRCHSVNTIEPRRLVKELMEVWFVFTTTLEMRWL